MFTDLVEDSLIAHQFVKTHVTETARFYVREIGTAVRFAILHKLDELTKPEELNAALSNLVPDEFSNNPSFRKNCDLICIHKLDKLSEFKNHEEQIFAIEEDPHFFKKYVLYYSDAEEQALDGLTYTDLETIIADKSLFNTYKEHPLAATQYSAVAKVFIKLPFLELPFVKGDLVPLRLQAEEAVSEVGLSKVYEHIQKYSSLTVDAMLKEMINDELANIKN
jgi:hypothetical protein